MPNICATCKNTIDAPFTLCEQCEINLAYSLLHVYTMIDNLHLLVDAAIHIGERTHSHGSSASAPTPIRLQVVDMLDYCDNMVRALHARLNPPTATGETTHTTAQPVGTLLLDIVADSKLNQLPDVGLHAHIISQLEERMSSMLCEHESMQPVGHCLNDMCGVVVYAPKQAEGLVCGTCGMVQQVDHVRLHFWTQCLNNTKLVTPVQAAHIINMCGIPLQPTTVRKWYERGRLHRYGGLYRLCDVVSVAQSKASGLTNC